MKEKNEVRMVWRWDDIFRVYRCPYCKGELEGVEGEENDH